MSFPPAFRFPASGHSHSSIITVIFHLFHLMAHCQAPKMVKAHPSVFFIIDKTPHAAGRRFKSPNYPIHDPP